MKLSTKKKVITFINKYFGITLAGANKSSLRKGKAIVKTINDMLELQNSNVRMKIRKKTKVTYLVLIDNKKA